LAGASLQYLIAAGRGGKFSACAWLVLGCFFLGVFWFADYVGGHVRHQSFDEHAQGLSVILLIVAFVASYFVRARMATSSRH
jgi:hypothetical protein